MRILFIARRFPPSVGGMERFAFDLSNALGKQVELVKIVWGGSNKWLPLVLPGFFIRAFGLLLVDKSIQVIHMQDAVQAPIGWLLSKIFRKPYVVVAHGLDITYNKFLYQSIILPFVRRADAVISISSATADEALKRGVVPQKSHVVTLGTHDDYGTPHADKKQLGKLLSIDNLGSKKIILTTGRMVRRKGVEWFIRNVLPQLVKDNSDLLYMVAGDGTQRPIIENAIKEGKLSERVMLLGRVDDKTRELLYQSADVFVMPNIVVTGDMEGFGIVAHEAATAAIPVVASDLEGIKDAIINAKNGILVPTEDKAAFIEEINKFLKDDSYRLNFGASSRAYTLKKYSWQSIAKAYESVYKRVIK